MNQLSGENRLPAPIVATAARRPKGIKFREHSEKIENFLPKGLGVPAGYGFCDFCGVMFIFSRLKTLQKPAPQSFRGFNFDFGRIFTNAPVKGHTTPYSPLLIEQRVRFSTTGTTARAFVE